MRRLPTSPAAPRPGEGGLTLTAPEIAENGNTVPIAVDAPGAVAIAIFAAGNPTPKVVTFNFGPLAGSQSATTRIRLAGTQDVIAVAQDGRRIVRPGHGTGQGHHRRLRRLKFRR